MSIPQTIRTTFFPVCRPTDDMLRAARRFARAFDLNKSQIMFGNRRSLANLREGRRVAIPPEKEVGERAFDKEKVYAGDIDALALSDDALPAFFQEIKNLGAPPKQGNDEWQQIFLRVVRRAFHKKMIGKDEVRLHLTNVMTSQLGNGAIVKLMAEAAYEAQVDLAQVYGANGGQQFGRAPLVVEEIRSLDARTNLSAEYSDLHLAKAEMGKELGQADQNQAWNSYNGDSEDESFFQASDQALQAYGASFQISQALQRFKNDPRVFDVFTRIAQRGNQKQAKAFFEAPIEPEFLTEDIAPRLLAMAKAVEIPYVKVKNENGSVEVLDYDHPALKVHDVNGRHINEQLTKLDPTQDHHAAVREGAVSAILNGEPRVALADILVHAGRVAKEKKLGRVDLKNVPKAHRESFLKDIFDGWGHVGAIGVLSGLLLDIEPRDLAQFIAERGYSKTHQEFVQTMYQSIQKVPDDKKPLLFTKCSRATGYCDVTDVGLRAQVIGLPLEEKTLQTFFLQKMKEGEDETDLSVALLDLASQFAEGSKQRTLLRSFIASLVESGEINPRQVRESLSNETKMRFQDDVRNALDTLLSEKSFSFSDLSRFSDQWGVVIEPETVAALVLDHFYQTDLETVLPLSDVDQKRGGVAGKRWQLLIPTKENEVALEGIRLRKRPQKSNADKLASADVGPRFECDSVKSNLRKLSAAWKSGTPMSVVQTKDAIDAENLVQHVAKETQTPLQTVDVGTPSDVAALFAQDGPVEKAAQDGSALMLSGLSRETVAEIAQHLTRTGAPKIDGKPIKPSPFFRLIVASNQLLKPTPASLQLVRLSAFSVGDMAKLLELEHGDVLNEDLRTKIVETHEKLQEVFSAPISASAIDRVGARMAHFLSNKSQLTPEALLRRELEDIYNTDTLPGGHKGNAKAALDYLLPNTQAQDLRAIEIHVDKNEVTIGDIRIRTSASENRFQFEAPERLVVTADVKEALYRLAKGLAFNEPVVLTGVPGSGRTTVAEMYADIIGKAYANRLMTSQTKVSDFARDPKDPPIHFVRRFQDGTPEVQAQLLKMAHAGEIQLILAEPPPANLLSEATKRYVPVKHLSSEKARLEFALQVGRKLGAPENVIVAFHKLHNWIESESKQGHFRTPSPDMDQETKIRPPALPHASVVNAIELYASTQTDLGIDDAYLNAIETHLTLDSEQDTAKILSKARDLAQNG